MAATAFCESEGCRLITANTVLKTRILRVPVDQSDNLWSTNAMHVALDDDETSGFGAEGLGPRALEAFRMPSGMMTDSTGRKRLIRVIHRRLFLRLSYFEIRKRHDNTSTSAILIYETWCCSACLPDCFASHISLIMGA